MRKMLQLQMTTRDYTMTMKMGNGKMRAWFSPGRSNKSWTDVLLLSRVQYIYKDRKPPNLCMVSVSTYNDSCFYLACLHIYYKPAIIFWIKIKREPGPSYVRWLYFKLSKKYAAMSAYDTFQIKKEIFSPLNFLP